MPDFLQSLSAFTVFLSLASLGFLFLIVSFTFGEIFEHFDFSHDVDHDIGHGGPSFFSPRIMSVFLTAFGGAGAIASYYGFTAVPASGFGFITGVFFAWLILTFARFLYGQQATTEVRVNEMLGKTGRIVVGIPKDGLGQVRCNLGEQLIDKVARSADGKAIGENTVVRIEQVLGEMVVVKRIEA